MQIAKRTTIGAILFAIALVGSSWLLRSNPLGDWVNAAIYISLGCFFTYQIVAVLPQVMKLY